jgi:dolichol-phosphate mannosyltransferase
LKLSVISPTFNEAENVPRLVEQLGGVLEGIDHEIIIVDDNSPDRTWSVAQALSLTNPRVRVIRRMHNPSLSAAVIDGFAAADGDVLACIDADLQHDPAVLPAMLEALLEGSDIVVASRYRKGGGTERWSLIRRMASLVATKMAHASLGTKLTDPMSGYFMFRSKNFRQVQGRLSAKGFKILLEIIAHLQPSSIAEVPYTFRARTAGESKLTSRVMLDYLWQLRRLSKTVRSQTRILEPASRLVPR